VKLLYWRQPLDHSCADLTARNQTCGRNQRPVDTAGPKLLQDDSQFLRREKLLKERIAASIFGFVSVFAL
jgi:hypothetical protein